MPSTTRPSTPASTASLAVSYEVTTCSTFIPASLSTGVNAIGEPADVVTNGMPSATSMSAIEASRTKAIGRFTPTGRSVRSRTRLMSSWAPAMPIEPGTRAMPPASATATTRSGFTTNPIGELAIGTSTPSSCVIRLSNCGVACGASGHHRRLRRRGLRPVTSSRLGYRRRMLIHTVGHGTFPADEFTDLLRTADLDEVVDVRSFPEEPPQPQCDREAMETWLSADGARVLVAP